MIRDEVKDISNMGELEGENAERAVGQVGRRERVHAHRFLLLIIIQNRFCHGRMNPM